MRRRNRRVTVRLNDAEFAHLQQQSEATGLGYDPLIRQLIMGLEIRPRPPDEYAALLRELSAIGNNINQIAHWANARKDIPLEEVQRATKLVKEAWTLVKETL